MRHSINLQRVPPKKHSISCNFDVSVSFDAAFLLPTVVDPENKNVIRQQGLETPQGMSAATFIPTGVSYNYFLLTFLAQIADLDQNYSGKQ